MRKQEKYTCPKCGSRSSSTTNIRTSGSLISSIFNIQNKRFNAVICSNCKYTELYNIPLGRIGEDLDLPERKKSFY